MKATFIKEDLIYECNYKIGKTYRYKILKQKNSRYRPYRVYYKNENSWGWNNFSYNTFKEYFKTLE